LGSYLGVFLMGFGAIGGPWDAFGIHLEYLGGPWGKGRSRDRILMILETFLDAFGEPFSSFFDHKFKLYSGVDFGKDFREVAVYFLMILG
jgi:hypothetical protein